ncbi:ankyrin repeat-containing domain protein [Apiospora rasikravindrae]|uniref:Ankyrin repeat-containing domain protein n=1 Tax=Apiospora rasikravindrae TaxID=990691 RepID=A0ABR1SMC8_9PEZI
MEAVASVVGIADFAGKLINGVGTLVVQYQNLPEALSELEESIRALCEALLNIDETLKGRPKLLPLEQSHYKTIARISQSCYRLLQTLDHELPELQACHHRGKKFIATLEKKVKDSRIQEIVSNINQRTTILQLSLTTLSLGAQAGVQQSQDRIQQQIRELTDRVRSLTNSSREHSNLIDVADVQNTESIFSEISAWKKTADDVAAAALLINDDSYSLTYRTSGETLPPYNERDEDDYDPEPDRNNYQNQEILELQLGANQNYVRHFVQSEIYFKAAEFQKRGIVLRKRLDGDGVQTTQELGDMQEELADILLRCGALETDQEARETLKALLGEEVSRSEEQKDEDRRCRLYHKLGEVYLRRENAKQASLMLQRAFDGRRAMVPMHSELKNTAEVLVKALRLDQAYDEALGIQQWVQQQQLYQTATPPVTPPADGSDLTKVYHWCTDNQMDIDAASFALDAIDGNTGTTPLHRAVEKEELEVVRSMLLHVANINVRDQLSDSTPLLVAATTRSRRMVQLLLEEGADVEVTDNSRMTALHRAQSKSGGVQVAELLLEARPEVLDEVDSYGKTALYLACERGNEKMVQFLLESGAKPNIQGPGQCTPLMVAVEVVAKSAQKMQKLNIVQLLISYGAVPRMRDNMGRTAFDVAKEGGLVADEIRKVLNRADKRRFNSVSSESTNRSSGSSRTG